MSSVALTREELFNLVWSKPMRVLAPEFGLSNVGLTKICRRHNVPTPGLGYWAKVEHGQKPRQATLPKLKPGASEQVTFEKRAPKQPATQVARQVPVVAVRDSLQGAHPAVVALHHHLDELTPDQTGWITVHGEGHRLCWLTRGVKRKALLLLDALARAATERGHEVRFLAKHHHGSERHYFEVSDGQEAIGIAITEQADRQPHTPRPKEYFPPKFDVLPTGRLSLELHVRWGIKVRRRKWSDGERTTVEGSLGDILLVIAEGFVAGTQRRIEEEEQRKRWREAERQRGLAAARANHQVALGKDLMDLADRWSTVDRVRRFVSAVDAHYQPDQRHPGFVAWLDWAKAYVASIDPLSAPPEELAKALEPRFTG